MTYQNHVETVKALIGAGANIEIKDEKKVIHFFMQVEKDIRIL